MLKKLCVLVSTILVLTVFCGCSGPNPPVESNSEPYNGETASLEVTVAVTRDFGREVLLEQSVVIEPGTSAMSALQMAADVTTKYGGGFVDSINGISSAYEGANKGKMDWFLYINGISSNVGASDYILQDGDVEQWDFRNWSYHHFVPAVIGHFPHPFRGGYKGNVSPTVVVYEEWLGAEAQSLVEKLKQAGVPNVSSVSSELMSEQVLEYSNLIVLAKMDNPLITEINSVHKKLGLYVYFEDGKIKALDAEGNLFREFSSESGVIQATQNPWNPKGVGTGESVVWMVTGTDEAGVVNAVGALMDSHQNLEYAFAAVVRGGEVIKVPQ